MSESLPIPEVAQADGNAVELVRVWAASGKLHTSIATNVWKDPAAWGIMLVDLAKHAARAYERAEGADYEQTLARIKAGSDAEWRSPTQE